MKFDTYPNLTYIGKLKTKKSTEIGSSRLGVGFETLDRDMWDANQAWPVINELGVKWARVQTGWAKCEKQAGVYDFAWLDDIVNKLTAKGVTPWLSFSYGNPVHTPGSSVTGVGYPPVYTEAERNAWQNYVEALVIHFRDRVDHYEVWNEPDLTSFWKRGPKAADYVDLVRLTSGPIRRLQPKAKVIGGAIAWGMTAWSIKFLEDCMKAGMHELVDIVTYHGYKSIPERHSTQELPAFKYLINKYKPSLKYWQGEAGVQSYVPETGNAGALSKMKSSESIQARMLLRRTLLELHHGCEMSSYFHMADFAHYAGDRRTYHYGLVRLADGSPKPAYYALQSLATLLCEDLQPAEGRTSCHMSVLSDTGDPRATKASTWHANFVRGNVPIHAWWFPESVEDDPVVQPMEMTYWIEAGLQLDNPVLVDPATQNVYAVAFEMDKRTCAETWMAPDPQAEGVRVFKPLPISNTPLILTDRSIVEVIAG
ncbi:MAG TPA: beta-galactosidase [Rariglobus sp.]|nr:beta-galactosidase [Rariglobus sp.]